MNKIIYIANARIPTEKAHGLQIMSMCGAFASVGNKVELVLPWRFNKLKDNPFDYYGLEKNFKITKLPSLDFVRFGKIGFWIQSLSFAIFAAFYIKVKRFDIIYSRDELLLYFLSLFGGKKLVWEIHMPKINFIAKRVLKEVDKIIAITQGLKDFYIKQYEIDSDKILVAPDGVDVEKFNININKEGAINKLNLPKNKKIVMYTGHLYDWKGAQTLADASVFLPDNTIVVFVGGTDEEVRELRVKNKELKNILIIGHKQYNKIPLYLKFADVLVLPNSGKSDVSKFYTSPMKLFEYMASGKPIVTSDLPSIREILSEDNAVLVEPDNSEDFAGGIKKILQNPKLADRITKRAFQDVQNYTWLKRAQNILKLII